MLLIIQLSEADLLSVCIFVQLHVLICNPSDDDSKTLQRMKYIINYTILQNKRMRRCGVWGVGCGVAPPPIIFERLKSPQQIIYRPKRNLSESLNHQKYWENILISRFYEQFSRSSRILGHFWKFEKISNS